jgi:hypothetical protein
MSLFNNLVNNLLTEQPAPVTSSPATRGRGKKTPAGSNVDTSFKDLETFIRNTASKYKYELDQLVNVNLLLNGRQWAIQRAPGLVRAGSLDEVTSKVVDIGQRIFTLLDPKSPDTQSVKTLDGLKEVVIKRQPDVQQKVVDVIKNVTSSGDIEQYDSLDRTLKNIGVVDQLSEVALEQFSNESIYTAVYKMLQKRAGILAATINSTNLKRLLLTPGTYIASTKGVPEPLEKTLADNSMHTDRILAIGVAAIEYYKSLENKKNRQEQTTSAVNASLNLFDRFTGEVLSEQNPPTTTTPPPIDPLNKKTWKTSPLNKEQTAYYNEFLTKGVADTIPSVDPEDPNTAIVYNVGYILRDPSGQAKALSAALQSIAHFVKTKKTLTQRLGAAARRLGASAVAAGSAAATLGGATTYVTS